MAKKVTMKSRGTATFYDDESMEFQPQREGTPRYESTTKVGENTISRTTGSVNGEPQKYVAHLKCDVDAPDPAAILHEAIDKLAPKMWPESKTDLKKPRGRVLLNEDGQFAALNMKTGELCFQLKVQLAASTDYVKYITNALTNFSKCLFINQALLLRAYHAQKNSSTK